MPIAETEADDRAQQIIAVARENAIPVADDPGLLAVLSALDVPGELPEEICQAVADILALVYRAEIETGQSS